MNVKRYLGNTLAAALFTLALATLANAQATRTWVSGVGDDVNPCSRTAPCKTFAGAISKTAINGEIDALDPGGFGTLTITKSITVDGAGTMASVLASGAPAGFTVNIAAGNINDPLRTVRIRNISINGTGLSGSVGTRTGTNGINILNANQVWIEGCVISDFSQNGIKADVGANTTNVYVRDTVVRNCGTNGITASASSGQFVRVMADNSFFTGNATGFNAGNNSRATASRSVIGGNSGNGVTVSANLAGAFAIMNLEHCIITANNGNGVSSSATAGTAVARISDNQITQNNVGVSVGAGGQVVRFADNAIEGNNTDGCAGCTLGTLQ
ncbi:MAG TPA: right-handed parallel beta-helix repeat-containing protein [Pyrinomonadaceae bacterium]|nr:right-handed parallel beta-helix repeat-containing protein [Pyrinomonadaceae bacterium]